MEQDLQAKVDQACRTAEEFTKLYYDSADKRRHLIGKLYLETGVLVWNGNATVGKDQIQKFYVEELPSSQHTLTSLDSQPVLDAAVANQLTFLIQVGGLVKYHDKRPKPFQQNFIVTAQGDKWKIVSDCFRLQEPVIYKPTPLIESITDGESWIQKIPSIRQEVNPGLPYKKASISTSR